MGGARHWVRSLYMDHPGYKEKNLGAFVHANRSDNKIKVICISCLPHVITHTQNEDESAVRARTRDRARTIEEIKAFREY